MAQINETLVTIFSVAIWIPWAVLTVIVYRYHRHHRSKPILAILYCSISLTIGLFFYSLNAVLGTFGYNSIIYIKLFSIFNLLGVLFWMRGVIHLVSPAHKERIIPQFVCWLTIVIVELIITGGLLPLEEIKLVHDILIIGYLAASFSISSFFLAQLNRRLKDKVLKRQLKMLIVGTLFPSLIHFFADIYTINQALPAFSHYLTTIFAWLSGLLIYFGVVFRGREIMKLFSFEGTVSLDPTIRDCRVYALLTDYTSPEGTCKFYERSLRSKCRLDPLIFRRDCRGVVFIDGFVCHQIRYHVDKRKDK